MIKKIAILVMIVALAMPATTVAAKAKKASDYETQVQNATVSKGYKDKKGDKYELIVPKYVFANQLEGYPQSDGNYYIVPEVTKNGKKITSKVKQSFKGTSSKPKVVALKKKSAGTFKASVKGTGVAKLTITVTLPDKKKLSATTYFVNPTLATCKHKDPVCDCLYTTDLEDTGAISTKRSMQVVGKNGMDGARLVAVFKWGQFIKSGDTVIARTDIMPIKKGQVKKLTIKLPKKYVDRVKADKGSILIARQSYVIVDGKKFFTPLENCETLAITRWW